MVVTGTVGHSFQKEKLKYIIHVHVCMATKTISITEEAYERLTAKKSPRESFSDVITRLTKKEDILELRGLLTSKEARRLEKNIKKSREKSRKRIERMTKMMK